MRLVQVGLLAVMGMALQTMAQSPIAMPAGYKVQLQTRFAQALDPELMLQGPRPESIQAAESPLGGPRVLKIAIKLSDDYAKVANGVPRAEVSWSRKLRFQANREYWIAWSVLIPRDYRFDRQQPEGISQIHPGTNIGLPPWSLTLINGHYQVDLRHDNDPKGAVHEDLGSAESDRGKWVFWSLRYRPDATGRQALVELYKNKTLALQRNGLANAYAKDNDAYFKMGLYKWGWKTKPSDVTERTLYFGDVTMAVKP